MEELYKNKILSYAKFYNISDDGKLENKLEEKILSEIKTVASVKDLFIVTRITSGNIQCQTRTIQSNPLQSLNSSKKF